MPPQTPALPPHLRGINPAAFNKSRIQRGIAKNLNTYERWHNGSAPKSVSSMYSGNNNSSVNNSVYEPNNNIYGPIGGRRSRKNRKSRKSRRNRRNL